MPNAMMKQPLASTDSAAAPASTVRQGIRALWRWLLGALCLALAWHALSRVAWDGVGDLLDRLGPPAIALLLGANLLMLPLMTARWWLLLKALDTPVDLHTACAYRLAVNAVNYLTPGPHVGGEPLSVFLLRHRHGMPLAPAATSVALDRLLEFFASMVILTLCFIPLAVAPNGPIAGSAALPLVAAVLILSSWVLAALFTGRRPLSRWTFLFKTVDGWYARWVPQSRGALSERVVRGEAMAASIFRGHRHQFLLANFFSLCHWSGVFAEFALMSALLGRPLSLVQLAAVVVVARLAFFTPLPAGIGVLESALPWVTFTMGQGSALGVSLCVIIRLRDLLFSLAGLGLTMHYIADK